MASRRVSVQIDADLSAFNRGVLSGVDNTRRWVRELESADSRLSAVVQTGLALAPAIAPIGAAAVPAIAGLTTQLGFAAVAGGTALLAFQGVGDALGALNDYQLEPTAENLEKLNEKMDALGPAGEVFVRQLQDMRDEFQGLQDVAQAKMFPGMAEGLESMMTTLPAFERVIGSVASAMGDLAADAGEGLASDEWVEFYDYLEREAGPILEAMGKSLGNFVEGITNMVMAFDPLSDDFTEGMVDMSEAFVAWSDGLDSSQGFQEFVRYVRESGPQAMETLGAIASALIEFVEAAAPVGAVVLPVLEVLADALAGIADSPAGPVIVGAAAAIGTLGRSLALLSAVGLRGTGDSVVGKVLGVETMKSYPAAARGVTDATNKLRLAQEALAAQGIKTRDAQFAMLPTAEKRKSVQEYAKAQNEVREATAAVAAAERDRSAAVRASAAQFGKTAAAAGGLALAASGAADGMGLSNTASMALMGTLAGPWGAAVGGAAGLTMDLRAANDGLQAAIRGVDAAIAEADLDSLTLQYQRLGEEMVKQEGIIAGLNAGIPGLGGVYDMLIGKTDEAGAKSEEAAQAIIDLKNAQADAAADRSFYNSLVAETAALEENVSAMRAKRDEALRGSNAMLNYQSALLDVRDAANANSNVLGRNGQLLAGQKRAGIEAKQSLNDMASAWNGLNDRAQNAPGAFRGAINSFVTAAEKMGIGRERAEQMARAILEIPNKHSTTISMEVDTAVARARAIKAELASIDRNIDVYVNIRRPNAGGMGPQVTSNAYGDVKDRHHPEIAEGGSWRVWAEPETGGESYIPHANDHRRPRARQILEDTAEILGARSVEWYAEGGSTDKKRRKPAFDNEGAPEATITAQALRNLMRATDVQMIAAQDQALAAKQAAWAAQMQLTAAEDNLEAAESQLSATQQLRDSLASSVSGQFSNSLTGGGLSGLMRTLSTDINAGSSMDATLRALAAAGLDTTGPAAGLFQELAASEDQATANQLLAAGPEMIAMLEQQYAQRAQINTGRGEFAAGASYDAMIAQQTAAVAAAEQQVAHMQQMLAQREAQHAQSVMQIERLTATVAEQAQAFASAVNSTASSAAQSAGRGGANIGRWR